MRKEEEKKRKRGESRLALASFILFLVAFSFSCETRNFEPQKTIDTHEVTDDLGRKVVLPVKIERAVSLAPSLTENIFAVGAGDRLVGVTTYCNYPEEVRKIAKVGDTINPNIETIVALHPDVVFVSAASQLEAFSNVLQQNHIAVFVTSASSTEAIIKSLRQLGEMFGTQNKTDDLIQNMQSRIKAVWETTQGGSKPKVFVQIERESLYTVGKDSFVTTIIDKAGGDSVTANVASAYPKLSKETASALNPDVIILSASDDNREPNDVFKNSPAVKNGKVYSIDADILSRPGPRFVDALEQIARDLHPESFR